MKRFLGICIIALAANLYAFAEDVYVLRPKTSSTGGATIWAQNAGLSAEVLGLYVPVSFKVAGKQIQYGRTAELTVSIQDKGIIGSTAAGDIIHFSVSFSQKPALPQPSKVISVKVKFSDLKKGDAFSESPGTLAMQKAILASKYTAGSAWIQSVAYDGKTTFLVKIALKK